MQQDKDKQLCILYTSFSSELPADRWNQLLESLPPATQQEILKAKMWKVRHSRLFGKLLLKLGLAKLAEDPLLIESLSRDEFGRPFVNGGVDFSISHSGSYVACAVAKGVRVGFDIEKKREIKPDKFKRFILQSQWETISTSQDPNQNFFDSWTTNESVVKGDGRGFFVSFEKIREFEGGLRIENTSWFVKNIFIHQDYSAHIATDAPEVPYNIEKVPIETFL